MKSDAKGIAVVGVFLAISVIALFLAGILPGVELTMYAIAGIVMTLVIREVNIAGGVFLYVGSLLLGFLILPNKLALLPYAFLFGPYGIVREPIEGLKKMPVRYALKLIVANSLGLLGFLIFKGAFFNAVELPDLAWPILLVAAEVMFIVYDIMLNLAMKVVRR